MRLILVRHGETSWNEEGRFQGKTSVGLSPRGQQQARALAQALLPVKPVAIYSSPLSRALETAEIIAQTLTLPLVRAEALREADLGGLEGLTSREMEARYPEFTARWRQDPSAVAMPGGESLAQLQERAWAAVQEMASLYPGEVVAAVSHHFTIRTVLYRLLGMPLSRFRQLQVDLGSITVVELREGAGRLLSLNDRCHLSTDERGGGH